MEISLLNEEEKLQVSTAVHSDVGKVRKANEDSYYVSEDGGLIIVCDGMGGQVAGGLASKIAVETIKDIFFRLDEEQFNKLFQDIDPTLARSTRLLISAVRITNRRLFNLATRFPKLRGMGTTVVAIVFDGAVATLVHVGDSRAFRISENTITQLTEDHSWLNELIQDNEINEEQIETFSQKNVITRALGTAPTVKIDLHCEKYKKDDIYFLCTDGLHNSIKNDEIKKELLKKRGSLSTLTKKLIEKAKERDGSDNITAAAAKLDQSSAENGQSGVSTTIPNEDKKTTAKLDRFIQETYTDSKLNLSGNSSRTKVRQKVATAGLVLTSCFLCFALGMSLKSKETYPDAGKQLSTNVYEEAATPDSLASHRATRRLSKTQKHGDTNGSTEVLVEIQRSKLSQDAVVAFVFFNSMKDYRNSRMEQRGDVLDIFYPYASNDYDRPNNKFTIFLIDSANNVIKKTAAVELPNYSETRWFSQ